MEDKDLQVEGQEVISTSPETTETPASSPNEESPAPEASAEEVDKDLTDWALNKGYSEDELQNPAVMKAVKMAKNAESFVGKQTPADQSASEDVDIDRLLDEMLGEGRTPEAETKVAEVLGDIDPSQLSPEEQRVLAILERRAELAGEKRAREIIAPYESDLRKKQYKVQIDGLVGQYGPDVIKNAPAILEKAKTGMSLEDATVLVLNAQQLKKAQSSGFTEGKETKAKEITQQVEQSKKTDSGPVADFNSLSLSEQKEVLAKLGLVK